MAWPAVGALKPIGRTGSARPTAPPPQRTRPRRCTVGPHAARARRASGPARMLPRWRRIIWPPATRPAAPAGPGCPGLAGGPTMARARKWSNHTHTQHWTSVVAARKLCGGSNSGHAVNRGVLGTERRPTRLEMPGPWTQYLVRAKCGASGEDFLFRVDEMQRIRPACERPIFVFSIPCLWPGYLGVSFPAFAFVFHSHCTAGRAAGPLNTSTP